MRSWRARTVVSWGRDTRSLARRFIRDGFRATLVCVDPRQLDVSHCGSAYDDALLDAFPANVDPCGENGEFHTFVSDAPMFSAPIGAQRGDVVERSGLSSATSCLVTRRAQLPVSRHVVERRLLCKLVLPLETKPGSLPFLRRMRAALLLLVPLTACLDAATGNVGNAPAPTAVAARESAARRVFSTGLTAPAADRKGASSQRTFARGRVVLKLRKDTTLEYHLNLNNPATENFTAAHIYRSGRSGPPVVTLFARASLKDKYIQVRGTGVLIDPVGKPLLEELRANPGAFYVSLLTTREPQGALLGTIQ